MTQHDISSGYSSEHENDHNSNFQADAQHSDGGAADDGNLGFGAGVGGSSTGTAGGARKKKASRKKASGRKAAPRKKPARKKAPARAETDEVESRGRDREDRDREDRSRDDRDSGDAAPRKKRTRRRKKAAPKSESDEREAEQSREDEPTNSEGDGQRRRRRGSRGGRRRKKKTDDDAVQVDALPGDENDLPDLPDEAEMVEEGEGGGKKKRRRRRSRRKKTSADGGDRDRERDDDDSGGDDDDEGRSRSSGRGAKKSKKKRASRKKATGRTKVEEEKSPEELEAEEEALRTQLILVNAIDPEEQRVAVVEGERISDLLMTSDSQKTLVNDIYRGRVVNLEPAIGAAFVDFGQGRNGFLHTSDVLAIYGEKGFSLDQLLTSKVDPDDWDEDSSGSDEEDHDDDDENGEDGDREGRSKGRSSGRSKAKEKDKGGRSRRRGRERRPISELLRVGDPVVVQVTKDAIGDKGPTLTTYISIPGRYLVLMPSMARTGVSRKIPDDKERRRLKRALAALSAPEDMGVIVRTAGIGKTKKDLQRDLDYLLGVWEHFGKRLGRGRGPAPLYQESNVAIRTMRDLFGPTTKEVVVDDPVVHEELTEFATKLMPEHVDRIRNHDAERPLFHHYGIEQDFEKVFTRRVELPSGGSIVFDQAEALVAIDVNSGRTRTDSFDFEEIALKTNLEAVPEIARQIRLRDLGGIIVCDFIDMMRTSSNRQVERSLRNELADDRARSKLGRVSQFGLLEMTRQRLGPGTHKKVFQACPRCRGTGRIRTVQSRAQAILRRLGSALTQKGFSTVEVRAHPEVVEYLEDRLWDYVRALEHRFEREIKVSAVPDQPEDSVLRYLRKDGREVRPGGRRKR
jgi:ribonuclease E